MEANAHGFPKPKFIEQCLFGRLLATRALWFLVAGRLRKAASGGVFFHIGAERESLGCPADEFALALEQLLECGLVYGAVIGEVVLLSATQRGVTALRSLLTALRTGDAGAEPDSRREGGASEADPAQGSSSVPSEPASSSDADAAPSSSTTSHCVGSVLSPDTAPAKRSKRSTSTQARAGRRRQEAIRWSAEAGWTGIGGEHLADWRAAFPGIDIDQELRRMHAWLRANPTKSNKSNFSRFIVNWLSNEQGRGARSFRPVNGVTSNGASTGSTIVQRQLARRCAEPENWASVPVGRIESHGAILAPQPAADAAGTA